MESNDAIDFHVLQGDVAQYREGNTKLYLRTAPEATGEYLGIVILAPSVPRWMSPHFADALKAHDEGRHGTDLNLYSQDWFEKIVYVPGEKIKPADIGSLDPYILPQSLVSHSLSTGCQQVSARTTIRPVVLEKNGVLRPAPELLRDDLKGPLYAIVYKHYKDRQGKEDLSKMAEITITDLDNVPNFASSPIHKQRLAESCGLRHAAVVDGKITGLRAKVFDAIRAPHHAP